MKMNGNVYRTLGWGSCLYIVTALAAGCGDDTESAATTKNDDGIPAEEVDDAVDEYVPLPEELREIDCSGVSEPELIATFGDFPNIGFLTQGNLMLVHDGFLYLAGLPELYRLDLSNPETPEMIYDARAEALVVHNDQVHFATGGVYRIPETGAEPEELNLAGDRVLSDGTSLFAWTDQTLQGCESQFERDRTLRRLDADGTVTELNEEPICAFGGSLGDGFLYFTGLVLDGDEVHTFRVPTEGGEIEQLELET